ncbi:acyltransferase family protein [Agrococcus sp. 1P02AA]|uniref:acyltransferase family protein n=1 Tax=Agrococcus sp. 1P02AA TaxID=3132259 RepID=UPI0039A54A55
MQAQRLEWVDVAKGAAIILVVLFHATLFLGDVGLDSLWRWANPLLETFRMPLFFFASGMFAGTSLSLPFAAMFRRRAWPLLWLYALWSTVFLLVVQVLPWAWADRPRPAIGDLLTLLLVPNASIWFIYALLLYSLVGWLLRPLPPWLQLAPAAVLSVLFGSGMLNTGVVAWDKILTYCVFFLLARHFASVSERLRPGWWAWPALAAYVVAGTASIALELTRVPGVQLVLSLGAIAAGILAAKTLARWRSFDWLRWIGERTLPIYVLHYIPIFLAAALLAPLAGMLAPVAALMPPMVALVAVLASLGVHRLLHRVPLLWSAPPLPRRRVAA